MDIACDILGKVLSPAPPTPRRQVRAQFCSVSALRRACPSAGAMLHNARPRWIALSRNAACPGRRTQAAVRNHTLPLPKFLWISRHGIDYISATSEPSARVGTGTPHALHLPISPFCAAFLSSLSSDPPCSEPVLRLQHDACGMDARPDRLSSESSERPIDGHQVYREFTSSRSRL